MDHASGRLPRLGTPLPLPVSSPLSLETHTLGVVRSLAEQSLIGAALIFCGFDIVASKVASIVVGCFFLLTLWWARKDWLTILTVLFAIGVIVAFWFIAHGAALRFYMLFVGVMSSLYSIFDICGKPGAHHPSLSNHGDADSVLEVDRTRRSHLPQRYVGSQKLLAPAKNTHTHSNHRSKLFASERIGFIRVCEALRGLFTMLRRYLGNHIARSSCVRHHCESKRPTFRFGERRALVRTFGQCLFCRPQAGLAVFKDSFSEQAARGKDFLPTRLL